MQKFLLGAFLLFSINSIACLYFKRDFDPKMFEEKEREAFMFHDGESANLIVKSAFQGKLPSELTWVLPLPSKPISFKEVNPEIFSNIRKIFLDQEASGGGMSKSRGFSEPSPTPKAMIQVHADVIVGNYKITPIEILSEDGGAELNQFLEKKGFFGMPSDIQKPYLKKGAYFLAITMSPKTTASGLVELKPLWIRYKSNELRYPLRFTHDYRTFDITLYFYSFPDAMASFKGTEKASLPWGGVSWSGMAEASKNYPELFKFLKPITEAMLLNKQVFKKYVDRLEEANNNRYSGVNLPGRNFDMWASNSFLYRIPYLGVNKNFKTRELKEDPGIPMLVNSK